jgi:cation diffusion facilitator family transporter
VSHHTWAHRASSVLAGGGHEHGHAHGLVDPSIVRSRAGVKAVLISLGLLGAAAAVQAVIFVLSGSVALLADLIHNAGDALTAIPVGAAFLLRSERAERWAGYAVVLAIFLSACIALFETIQRLIHPEELSHLWALAGAGLIGFLGNELAARVRLHAGKRLSSPALVADGKHARVDGFVSLGVIASAALLALGLEVGDPIVGLLITLVILKVTWDAWRTIRDDVHGHGN